MIQPGDTIGPYILVRTLGRGAFGEVWLAERASSLLTTQVALKLPFDAGADLDAIRQEADAWLRASGHPNIVPVLEAEVYDGQVVIASEYVAGGSLADWLAPHGGKAPSVDVAVEITRGILDGLQHLHEAGLIHRDLKPGNVLLQKGRPRLTDFGLTRVLKAGTPWVGHTTNLAGTPGYMAPEAFRGDYTAATDVWSAGILLYELFVGTLPYPHTDFYSLLLAITADEPVVLSDKVPVQFRPVLIKALAKPVSERFDSSVQMAEALAVALASPSVSSRGPQPPQRHNLPIQTTSFIGRKKEIAEIKTLLARTRLLALTGSGGCGKTRLSLHVAEEVLDEYPDGVWIVELASLTDPALVPRAVVQGIGVTEEPDKPLIQTLVDALKTKNMLLVLDNCEHLLAACAKLVDALIHAGPGVKVLASSREGLNIAGELTYRVPSLSCPDHADTATAQSIKQYESVLLFVERAQFYQPSFTLTNSNAPGLASVCRRLDGIPLAIELAAVRIRSLTVEELEQRLDNRFRILTGGSRTALPRQQTLRALIDWSYDLLDEDQKALFCRLCVFAGGWTLAAAEHVCAGSSVEEGEILNMLSALNDKSLIVAEATGGATRYRLLETVRQYAREKLASHADGDTYRRQHRDFFLLLAEETRGKLRGSEQARWLSVLQEEHDNMRRALTLSLDDPAGGEYGLRLGAALWWFWSVRGHLSEGRERLKALLSHSNAQERTKARANVLNGAGILAEEQGDYTASRFHHEESLAIKRELGDRSGTAGSLNNLGNVARIEGDFISARSLYEEALAINRELGNRAWEAINLGNLGNVAYGQGDYASSCLLHGKSLTIKRELGDKQGIAVCLSNLGLVAYEQGEYTSASSLLEQSLAIHRELSDRQGTALCLSNLALVNAEQGNYALARSLLEESLIMRRDLADKHGILESLEGLASVAANEQHWKRSARLWASAEALRETIGSPLPPNERERYDRAIAAAREAAGAAIFAAEWEKGRALTMEQTIAFALEGQAHSM
jgi:predicted ATPase